MLAAMVELDHFFACMPPSGDWPASLENAGFRLDSGTVHEGQGTRNRRLLLQRHYLEWVWLHARGDAETNALRLDRRADWERTGWSPFGIGLRGSLADAGADAFEEYRPPYAMNVAIWIARACAIDPSLPLIFLFDIPDAAAREKLWPVNRAGGNSPLLGHVNGATGIASISIEGCASAWPLAVTPPGLALASGPAHRVEIALRGLRGPSSAPAGHVVLRAE
jgi:hypothetical protein